MTCQVIKTIKGKQYLYEQTSYRVEGKVRTESRYLGAVDPSTGQLKKSSQKSAQAAKTAHLVEEVIKPTSEALEHVPQESTPEQSTEKPQKLTLQIKADLEAQKISRRSTESAFISFGNFLQNKGIQVEHIPEIQIKNGKAHSLRKSRLQDRYIVTIPKAFKSGSRGEFWRTYRKAQAKAYLDALERTDLRYFEGLKGNIQIYYKRQNQAIAAYIMRSKRKEVFKIGLTLHFLYSKMVSAWTEKHLSPEKIGLANYSNRSTWRDDVAALMAEIQEKGWTECFTKYQIELHKVERLQFSLVKQYRELSVLDTLSGKKRDVRREYRKVNARRKAIFEALNKLSVLAPLYDGFRGESLQGSERPFQHEHQWQETREGWRRLLTNS